MKHVALAGLAIFLALPLRGQGLTITLKETGPAGTTAPTMQMDKTHARLDIPSMASQVLYDSGTKTLQVLVPLLRVYREYTPATVQQKAAADAASGKAQVPTPITYKKGGTAKVGNWSCTNYEGVRGNEKVVEICAAEGVAIALTAADFTLAQQAIDMIKAIAPPDIIERIPVYGTARSQGYTGFPVRRVSFKNGRPDVTTELVDIKRGVVPAATFAVPAGFNKAP